MERTAKKGAVAEGKAARRVALFCLYQKSARLPRDVGRMIGDLRKNVGFLAVVINGAFEDAARLEGMAELVIRRENLGFDGGAYKAALNEPAVREVLAGADELVLCNDTFYGPFIPFADIFAKMDGSSADFWGIRLSDNGFCVILQSFFLVFRKKILRSGALGSFFAMYPERSSNFNDALIFFERNIFCYLSERGYAHDAFYTMRYKSLDADIIHGKSPVLKKKHALDPGFGLYERDMVLRILRFVSETYGYDVGLIIEDAKERYGVDLSGVDLSGVDLAPADTRKAVEAFAARHPAVYVYGLGFWARNVISVVGLEKVAAFIVSDGRTPEGCYGNKMVYRLSHVTDTSAPIIIAANKRNTAEILPSLAGFKNVLNLWGAR